MTQAGSRSRPWSGSSYPFAQLPHELTHAVCVTWIGPRVRLDRLRRVGDGLRLPGQGRARSCTERRTLRISLQQPPRHRPLVQPGEYAGPMEQIRLPAALRGGKPGALRHCVMVARETPANAAISACEWS